MELILTFLSPGSAIAAAQTLLARKLTAKVMPLPSTIKAGCGLCLRVSPEDEQPICRLLKKQNLLIEQMYLRTVKNGISKYTKYGGAMTNHFESLLSNCTSGGCGAKIGPNELASVLDDLPQFTTEQLLVGFRTSDDAAIYALDDEKALVSTVDFFPPMVDDPYLFGQIAACNALSDVYAMGGRPFLALNLVCFPEKMPKSVLGQILAGGMEKIREAGAVVGGGHSIYDKEVKYGLSVNGFVPRSGYYHNDSPREGHTLILTKPLGVGIILAADRVGLASEAALQAATDSMCRLNRYAAEKLPAYHVSACTDITGFGLLNHLLEMCGKSVSAELWPEELPIMPEAAAYADDFLLTAAGQRNRNHFASQKAGTVDTLPFSTQELLFDPQTSGGLLICTDTAEAPTLLAAIQKDDPKARIIGQILPRQSTTIQFRR